MLANVVGTMDRLAVGTYHTKIYEHCLEALDLRRQNLDSLKNINLVEQSIIHTIITLTMKLTESTFRPLFLRTLEWAESEVDQSTSKRSMDRAIVFYKLVNKLAEQHRYSYHIVYWQITEQHKWFSDLASFAGNIETRVNDLPDVSLFNLRI